MDSSRLTLPPCAPLDTSAEHWEDVYRDQYQEIQHAFLPRYYHHHPQELEFLNTNILRLCETYARDRGIIEFGCGPGHHLSFLIEHDWMVMGAERSAWARKICALQMIDTYAFDFLSPHWSGTSRSWACLTVGALEQVPSVRPFLDWLHQVNPSVIIHIEPLEELYDPHDHDDMAKAAYHGQRGYATKILSTIRSLPWGEILHVKRQTFPDMPFDPYSEIVWTIKQ